MNVINFLLFVIMLLSFEVGSQIAHDGLNSPSSLGLAQIPDPPVSTFHVLRLQALALCPFYGVLGI